MTGGSPIHIERGEAALDLEKNGKGLLPPSHTKKNTVLELTKGKSKGGWGGYENRGGGEGVYPLPGGKKE